MFVAVVVPHVRNENKNRQKSQLFPGMKINKSSAIAEVGDRLATVDMDRKVPLLVELDPHLTQWLAAWCSG